MPSCRSSRARSTCRSPSRLSRCASSRSCPATASGLALLTDDGQEFQTYTARVNQHERRTRPRPDVVFKTDRTALGSVVRSREPLIINDTSVGASDFLDINVLHTAGLGPPSSCHSWRKGALSAR